MNGEKRNIIALAVITLVLLVIGITGYVTKTEEKETLENKRFYLKNSGGSVMFEHEKHIKDVGTCGDCHHTVLTVGKKVDCNECHDDFDGNDFTHDELTEIESHNCTSCHEEENNKKPMNCRDCHSTTVEQKKQALSCTECHDDFNKSMFTHDVLVDVEDHSCDACHEARSVTTVYHEQCNNCHMAVDMRKFTSDKGKVSCRRCHLK